MDPSQILWLHPKFYSSIPNFMVSSQIVVEHGSFPNFMVSSQILVEHGSIPNFTAPSPIFLSNSKFFGSILNFMALQMEQKGLGIVSSLSGRGISRATWKKKIIKKEGKKGGFSVDKIPWFPGNHAGGGSVGSQRSLTWFGILIPNFSGIGAIYPFPNPTQAKSILPGV